MAAFFVWQRTIVDAAGTVQPLASVSVTDVVSGALATLYSDEGVTGIGNPITADSNGFVRFYVRPGLYDIVATLGANSRTWNDEAIGNPFATTQAETAAGVAPVDHQCPEGHVLRYKRNATPGTTDMTAAFQSAGLVSLNPYAPAGTYKISGSIPIIEGQTWRADGAHLSIAGSVKVFTVAAGVDDWAIAGNWLVVGDNNATGSLSGTGAGLYVEDSMYFSVGPGFQARAVKGWGIFVGPASSVNGRRSERGVIASPQCFYNYVGIEVSAGSGTSAEYLNISNPNVSLNDRGMVVSAGNCAVSGGTVTDNRINVDLEAGGNHAHGIFSGTQINHGVDFNVRATSVTNGHAFVGCNLYDGIIKLDGCTGITFRSCFMDPDELNVVGTSGYSYCTDCYWPGNDATVLSGASIDKLVIMGAFGPGSYDGSGFTINDPSPVYVHARRAAAATQSLTTGVTATLLFPTEVVDRRLAFDPATGIFTVPAGMAGTYRIEATCMFEATGIDATATGVIIRKNSASSTLHLPGKNGTTTCQVTAVSELRLAASDTIDVRGVATGTTPVFGNSTYESTLTIKRVS